MFNHLVMFLSVCSGYLLRVTLLIPMVMFLSVCSDYPLRVTYLIPCMIVILSLCSV